MSVVSIEHWRRFFAMYFKIRAYFIILVCISSWISHLVLSDDRARFDNYRIYEVHLNSQNHIPIFQELQKRSDSYIIYLPVQIDIKTPVMVAAHKIAEFTDLLQRFNVPFKILVREKHFTFNIFCFVFCRIFDLISCSVTFLDFKFSR